MNARKNFLWGCVIASLMLLAFVSWKTFGPSPPSAPTPTLGDTSSEPTTGSAPSSILHAKAPVANQVSEILPAAPEPAIPWDEKLDSILRSPDPESGKATNLLNLFARLSGEPQQEVAQHMVNLLSDEQFPAATPWLLSTNTSEPVRTILLNDLLNRSEPLKLPLFLEIARTEGHPNAEEAKTYLEVYVDHDYRTNWDEWAKAIENYLKEKAQEYGLPGNSQ